MYGPLTRPENSDMNITDLLDQSGALQSMARELGVRESDVARGAAALAPAILGGLKHQAESSPSGLGGLLDQLGGGGLLDNVLSPQPTDVSHGNMVLDRIIGSKDVSRTVVESAASQTGLDASLLGKMLPRVAMLVAGALARQQDSSLGRQSGSLPGGLGGMLGGILGGPGRGGAGGSIGSTESSGPSDRGPDAMGSGGLHGSGSGADD
jgi:hypothetical protein